MNTPNQGRRLWGILSVAVTAWTFSCVAQADNFANASYDAPNNHGA